VRSLRAFCFLLAACSGSVSEAGPTRDAGNADGESGAPFDASANDAAPAIGAPCIPSSEANPSFDGFTSGDIELAPIPTSSGAPTCLVDHFRGLVTCPYGQSATGQAPAGASPCITTGGQPVTGAVEPQCTDRLASAVVVWSCRCANTQGQTDDGSQYCSCPSGTACVQTITPLGAEEDFSGAYCLSPAATAQPSCATSCNPATAPCP
jgi:hypothetical protein